MNLRNFKQTTGLPLPSARCVSEPLIKERKNSQPKNKMKQLPRTDHGVVVPAVYTHMNIGIPRTDVELYMDQLP